LRLGLLLGRLALALAALGRRIQLVAGQRARRQPHVLGPGPVAPGLPVLQQWGDQ
jgi:hypothetical protein